MNNTGENEFFKEDIFKRSEESSEKSYSLRQGKGGKLNLRSFVRKWSKIRSAVK